VFAISRNARQWSAVAECREHGCRERDGVGKQRMASINIIRTWCIRSRSAFAAVRCDCWLRSNTGCCRRCTGTN